MLGFWMVRILNGWGHSCSPTLWKPDHLISNFQKVRISCVPRFWMVGFQIPTAVGYCTQIKQICSPFEWQPRYPTPKLRVKQIHSTLDIQPLCAHQKAFYVELAVNQNTQKVLNKQFCINKVLTYYLSILHLIPATTYFCYLSDIN